MFKYQGVSCPACGEEFKETDEILICPECGAPYHRHCIEKLGRCQFDDLHQKGESWEPPKTASKEEKYDGRASLRCSRCGTINPVGGLFCEVCGTPLNSGSTTDGPESQANANGPSQQTPPPGFQGWGQMAYNPYTTPFGGLGPDEEIDGVPVKDLALYVRQNTHYFLPRFKENASGRRGISWNWAAFLLDIYYLFYRKMWGFAAIITVVTLVLSIPNMALIFSALFSQLGMEPLFSEQSLQFLDTLSNIFYVLSLLLKFGLGAFTNRIYQRKVFRDIDALSSQKDDPSYSQKLAAKGGVSTIAVVLCVAVTIMLSVFSSTVMMMTLSQFTL